MEAIATDVLFAVYIAIALPARPSRTAVVFTPEYLGAIERTPYLRPKQRMRSRIFLGLFLMVVVYAIAGAILSVKGIYSEPHAATARN